MLRRWGKVFGREVELVATLGYLTCDGRIRLLEGDGQWERTEGRTEAGGSNSNHTDEAWSPPFPGK